MSKAARHKGRVARLGCVVCRNLGHGESPAEVHHIGDTADRSDFLVVPLCPIHHRQGGLGVAFHCGPKEFERVYGSELSLLAQTIGDLA